MPDRRQVEQRGETSSTTEREQSRTSREGAQRESVRLRGTWRVGAVTTGKFIIGAVGLAGFVIALLTYIDQHATRVSIYSASMREASWLRSLPDRPEYSELTLVTVTLANDASTATAISGGELRAAGRTVARAVGQLEGPPPATNVDFLAGPLITGQAPLPLNLPARQGITRTLVFQTGSSEAGTSETPPPVPPWYPQESLVRQPHRAGVELTLHLQGGAEAVSPVTVKPRGPESVRWSKYLSCDPDERVRALVFFSRSGAPPQDTVLSIRLWNLDRRDRPIMVTRPAFVLGAPSTTSGEVRIRVPLRGLKRGVWAYTASSAGIVFVTGQFRLPVDGDSCFV
jgi:hypothetical protein